LWVCVVYSHDEHRATLKRILAVTKQLAETRAELQSIRDDLHDDDAPSTEEARSCIRAVSMLVTRAEKGCDEAVTALPTPLSRPRVHTLEGS